MIIIIITTLTLLQFIILELQSYGIRISGTDLPTYIFIRNLRTTDRLLNLSYHLHILSFFLKKSLLLTQNVQSL